MAQSKRCANCERPFRTWWNWMFPWMHSVTRFCVGVYCFDCAKPEILFFAALDKFNNGREGR